MNPKPAFTDRPLAAITCAFALGIALSQVCRAYSFPALAAADLGILFAAFLALRRNRLLAALSLGIAATSMGGLLTSLACRDAFSDSDLRSHIARGSIRLGEPVSSEGCVQKESEPRGDESVATIELLAFLNREHWVLSKGKAIIRISNPESGKAAGGELNLMRGDRIRAWVTWNPPRNFENPGSADSVGRLMRQGIFLVGTIKSSRLLETIPGGCLDPWTRIANSAVTRVRLSLEPLRASGKKQRAAILSSLTIGDYSGIDTGTREIFQNSGTFHVLVVSGLHVAWIAGLLLQLFKCMRLPERVRYALTFFVILLYACIVGSQASISRCLWMFLLYLIGRVLFRQADAANILLGAALLLLSTQPAWLLDAGFQLSFVSVLAIALMAAPAVRNYLNPVCRPLLFCGKSDRLFLEQGMWHRIGRRLRVRCELCLEVIADSASPCVSGMLLLACRCLAGLGHAAAGVLVTSLAVQVWLMPLLAFYFNRMSWISPLANIVIVPLSSFALAAGAAAAVAANLPFLDTGLSSLAGTLSGLLLSCAKWTADIPGAWQRCPTPSPAWVAGAILLLFAWCFFEWRRILAAIAGIGLMLACISFGSIPVLGGWMERLRHSLHDSRINPWTNDEAVLSIAALDVGEGDSIVIRFPDTRIWVLDAGGIRQPPSAEDGAYIFDVGEAVVSRYLWHFWVGRLDRVLISHPDLDHAGGIGAVLRNFPVLKFSYPRAGSHGLVSELLSFAGEKHISTEQLHAGVEEKLGRVTVQVLNPPDGELFGTTNENSLVLRLSYGKFAALLTGDLEKSGEAFVMSHTENMESPLLKVAHHGSRSGSSNSFLDRTRPRWAILSVGRNNPFGHPSKETVSRLLRHKALTVSTVDYGAITLETDGRHYVLKSHLRGLLEKGDL